MAARKARTAPDLLEAAFALIARVGWRDFSLAALAREEGVALARVYDEFQSRDGVLRALGARLDRAMLAIPAEELEGLAPRERIFELVMRRFDALAPFKPALRAMGRDAVMDPAALLRAIMNLDRSAAWLLEASGAGLKGLAERLARAVLIAIYARVFTVWLDDDTPDLARTLAELDKRLQQAELVARRVMPRPRAEAPEPPAAG
jgi:AcrR family transcriptional regulator